MTPIVEQFEHIQFVVDDLESSSANEDELDIFS
jgi:hypothetical protein